MNDDCWPLQNEMFCYTEYRPNTVKRTLQAEINQQAPQPRTIAYLNTPHTSHTHTFNSQTSDTTASTDTTKTQDTTDTTDIETHNWHNWPRTHFGRLVATGRIEVEC